MSGWDELVATALLGTARRPFPVAALPAEVRALLPADPGADDATRLLDAAALLAAYRRAGTGRTAPAPDLPAPAPAETRPTTSPAATATLQLLLAGGDGDLVAEFLTLTAGRGLVVAPAALPALLAAGASNRALAALAAPVLGERGRWLAQQHAPWRPQLRPDPEEAAPPVPDAGARDRALARAGACVRLTRVRLRRRFEVEPPLERDAGMVADGIAALGPHESLRSEGLRAHWLRQVVAATPLEHWTQTAGAPPEAVLALPVADGWGPTLVEGWCEAAARQRDPDWARALLPHPQATARRELLAVLAPQDRAAVVAGLLRARGTDAAQGTAVLRDCPRPWSPPLATAALADTASRSWPAAQAHALSQRLDLLAHRLPPASAGPLHALAERADLADAGREAALRALDVLALRARAHADLEADADADPDADFDQPPTMETR